MRGERAPKPTRLSLLGAGWKLATTGATTASGIGLLLSRSIRSEAFSRLLTGVSVLAFIAATAYAVVTVPKERRQSIARLAARARTALSREVVSAAKAHLGQVSASQRTQLSRHLAAEGTRFKSGAGNAQPGAAAPPPAAMAGGFMPADVAKLRGEWKIAIENHLAKLETTAT
jgi:hypothetical protein